MVKEKINNLDLELYKEVLDNGLKIYICPLNRREVHASIATKFGNDILQFIPKGKKDYITIPTGSAHFLEHKMFAKEDGADAMSLFASNGAVSNAYTTSKVTRYFYTCTDKFFNNLKILLDCITKPYFTNENIAKEQGIINEEINMYFDEPEEMLYITAIDGLFHNHPHKYPVTGYSDTISELNQQLLYDTYNTFYNPSNMFIVITGNVDPIKTIDYIKNYYDNLNLEKIQIKTKDIDEPENVCFSKKEINMDVTNKLLGISYKIKLTNMDKFKQDIYLSMYLDILFGPSSQFYADTFKDKNVVDKAFYLAENLDDYYLFHLGAEVLESEEIIDKMDNLIQNKKISKEDFDLINKLTIKSLIMASDNIMGVANMIFASELDYNDFDCDIYNKYKDLNYEEFMNYIKSLDFTNSTRSTVKKS